MPTISKWMMRGSYARGSKVQEAIRFALSINLSQKIMIIVASRSSNSLATKVFG